MSKVMQALEHSERSRQSVEVFHAHRSYSTSQRPRNFGKKSVIALAIVPPILVFGLVAFQTYQANKQSWLEQNVAQTVMTEVPFEYQTRQIPDFGPLAVTYREDVEAIEVEWLNEPQEDDNELPPEVVIEQVSGDNSASSSGDDLLSGLDLSQLSPELAQRFESALSADSNQRKQDRNGEVSQLSQQADLWYGKLPAMNFQTHVYSSKPNKRWVKINGIEYNQGDWVSDDIELVSIDQRSCVIRFKGVLIEVPALYDWQG